MTRPRASLRLLAIGLAFGASGGAGLLAEQSFEKLLGTLLGTSTPAGAVVLGTYFGGLTLGGWLYARRRAAVPIAPSRAFATYAKLEGAIALACALLAVLATELVPLFVPLLRLGAGSTVGLFAVRLVVAACWILPVTVPMGATFPAIVDALDVVAERSRGAAVLGVLRDEPRGSDCRGRARPVSRVSAARRRRGARARRVLRCGSGRRRPRVRSGLSRRRCRGCAFRRRERPGARRQRRTQHHAAARDRRALGIRPLLARGGVDAPHRRSARRQRVRVRDDARGGALRARARGGHRRRRRTALRSRPGVRARRGPRGRGARAARRARPVARGAARPRAGRTRRAHVRSRRAHARVDGRAPAPRARHRARDGLSARPAARGVPHGERGLDRRAHGRGERARVHRRCAGDRIRRHPAARRRARAGGARRDVPRRRRRHPPREPWPEPTRDSTPRAALVCARGRRPRRVPAVEPAPSHVGRAGLLPPHVRLRVDEASLLPRGRARRLHHGRRQRGRRSAREDLAHERQVPGQRHRRDGRAGRHGARADDAHARLERRARHRARDGPHRARRGDDGLRARHHRRDRPRHGEAPRGRSSRT